MEYTNHHWKISLPLLITIIFVEGFISLSVEVLTIRQLVPVAGNSVVVTSFIIGFFLLSLALGYHRGGYHDGDYNQILINNFTWVSALIGIGLSYPFVITIFILVGNALSDYTLVPLVAYLLVITCPAIYLLGQTLPLATNMFRQEQRVSVISGKALAMSTVGSFFGAILTSVVLMNYVGVGWTVLINSFILCLLILILIPNKSQQSILIYTLLPAILCLGYLANVDYSVHRFIWTNAYANYSVKKYQGSGPYQTSKVLYVNGMPHSKLTAQGRTFPYLQKIKDILFKQLKLHNKEILVIGAGGFTLSNNAPQNHFIYVDIDPQIKWLAKKHFNPNIKGRFIAEDGRRYLNENKHQYDAALIDAFSGASIPDHLLTKSFMQLIKSHIKPGGIVVFNIIADPLFKDKYSVRVNNTIHAVFNRCTVSPEHYNRRQTNIIYTCYRAAKPDKTVYTDNRNTATLDHFKLMKSIKSKMF